MPRCLTNIIQEIETNIIFLDTNPSCRFTSIKLYDLILESEPYLLHKKSSGWLFKKTVGDLTDDYLIEIRRSFTFNDVCLFRIFNESPELSRLYRFSGWSKISCPYREIIEWNAQTNSKNLIFRSNIFEKYD